ncbi:hypothetical protein MPSEU_000849100 [Mayamaea pseudoterrestris]|nr:hypothetical protein MPSEU_000849100 [Mayamaea pseudoterrestris]
MNGALCHLTSLEKAIFLSNEEVAILGKSVDTFSLLRANEEGRTNSVHRDARGQEADIESGTLRGDEHQHDRTLKRLPPFAGKKGVCFLLRDEFDPKGGTWVENLPKVKKLKPYWNYAWSPKRIAKQPSDIEFVPMLWGAWSRKGLRETIQTVIMPQVEAGQAKRMLVFNEPDSTGQANINVAEALSYWPIAQRSKLPLGSPACVDAKNSWMTDFVAGLNSNTQLHMDYLTVHWYGRANAEIFKQQIQSIYEYHDKKWPLWITEFAPADWAAATPQDNKFSRAQVLDFMKEVIPWLESQDFIVAYSWFSFPVDSAAGTCSALFDSNGRMTALGKYYASVRNENPEDYQSI